MQPKMTVKEFLNTCELKLLRAEGVSRQAEKLQVELIELEELLRNQWPDASLFDGMEEFMQRSNNR